VKSRWGMAAVVVAASCAPVEAPEIVRPLPEPSPEMIREATTAFRALRDGFLEWYYEANPVRASELGILTYDDRLTAIDRVSVQRRIDALLDWDGQLRRIPNRLMRGADRFDHAILEYGIRGELLDLEEIRWWAVDPISSLELIERGLATLVDHRSPGPARTAALQSRLAGTSAVLAAARSNLRSPPRIWTERAIEEARALGGYVDAIPERLAASGEDGAVVAQVASAASAAAAGLRAHADWMEGELLHASTGDFRLGRYLLARRTLYQEHLDLPPVEQERLNEQSIEELRNRLAEVAREVDPARSPRAILDSLARVEVEPVQAARSAVAAARAWTVASGQVTVPDVGDPAPRLSPGVTRPAVAELWAPGPLAPAPAPAFLDLTGVTPSGQAIAAAALHETYPGRYVQVLLEREVPGDLRRVFTPRTLTGGWAEYAERLAVSEGFGADDPALRLVHIQRALVAQARWYAALQLHAHGRATDPVAARVAEIALLDPATARRWVVDVARDPLAGMDAMGGLRIAELRARYEEYVTGREETFDPRAFHDQFLRLGLPIPLATEALMPAPETPARPRRRP
jgi:hypothetical protein